ncbi:fe2+ zn2+ uptake regulation protein [Pseudomonas citrulli]|uniref:Fe2+ zn2+ uptake regulation protein n=1 Tax=Pseudomonas citrulli TaxID=3064347 RepID=A0ABT9BVE2_9PSED|nr:fe2+ zn2+ uptake regulation protein [Pseudomonas sp. K18]MDO7895960.1 fe2+ zn2+ uptake regulation protein [Pseudomonas sp. K18]
MQGNPGTTPSSARPPLRPAADPLAHDPDRCANEPIRDLLRFYGLRTSLIRFKVINALLGAALDGRSMGARGVHAKLAKSSADLSFVSVREVLKRLSEEGVIVFQADKTYCFTAEAWTMLEQHPDHGR